MQTPDLETLNSAPHDEFVRVLGGIFERSAWVADRAAATRPFRDVDALHGAMVAVVERASRADQIGLLRAHPELAGREAREGGMTDSSVSEQASAGLHALTAEEVAHMNRLNAQYRERFGFPCIIAVRNHTKQSIFAEMERRLGNDADVELGENLRQIYAITRMRLDRTGL
jgi:2-oxo-4-hydroxy-4-carboxy-5-ureidoimidazoline decarboxylase